MERENILIVEDEHCAGAWTPWRSLLSYTHLLTQLLSSQLPCIRAHTNFEEARARRTYPGPRRQSRTPRSCSRVPARSRKPFRAMLAVAPRPFLPHPSGRLPQGLQNRWEPVWFNQLSVKPVRSSFGLGRYQIGPNSKFKFKLKKIKNFLKIL